MVHSTLRSLEMVKQKCNNTLLNINKCKSHTFSIKYIYTKHEALSLLYKTVSKTIESNNFMITKLFLHSNLQSLFFFAIDTNNSFFLYTF